MRMIASNNRWTQARRLPGRLIPDQYVLPRDCTLEAMRTQGRFSIFIFSGNRGATC
jgi:hypothetical protein